MSWFMQSDSHIERKLGHLEVAAIGVARTVLGLPIQHPFETLKTWMQSQHQTAPQAVKQIYSKKGIKGFYSGFWLNCLRAVSKNVYRWPMSVFLINRFRVKCREWNIGIGAAGAGAGLITALFESFIVCPIERGKTWLMTADSNTRMKAFWKFLTLKNMYDGFSPLLLKQILSWVSFLGTQQYLKQLYYQYLEEDSRYYEFTNKQLLVISLGVCLVNTAFVMPADYVKTHFQKHTVDEGPKPNLRAFIRKAYHAHGIRGFYRGGTVKIIYYNINSMLTVPLMEKVLRVNEQ